MFTLANNITIIIFTKIRDKGRIKHQTVPDFNVALFEPISPSLSGMMSCEQVTCEPSSLWPTLAHPGSNLLFLTHSGFVSGSLCHCHSRSFQLTLTHVGSLQLTCYLLGLVRRSCVAPVYPALIYKTWYLLEKAKF